jgi:hypothetical protein
MFRYNIVSSSVALNANAMESSIAAQLSGYSFVTGSIHYNQRSDQEPTDRVRRSTCWWCRTSVYGAKRPELPAEHSNCLGM